MMGTGIREGSMLHKTGSFNLLHNKKGNNPSQNPVSQAKIQYILDEGNKKALGKYKNERNDIL